MNTSRTYRGVGQDQRVAARRSRLIDAGITVLGSRGFRGATIGAVATEAGLTKRYFYESFETLEDLLAEVYTTVVEDLRSHLSDAVTTQSNAVDKLLVQLDAYLAWSEKYPERARIQLVEIRGVSPRVDQITRKWNRQFISDAADLFELEAGALTPGQRTFLGAFLVGGGLKLSGLWLADPDRPARDELIADARMVLSQVLPRMLQQI
ncbi:TetR/AcrR family transcriptional regulator [Nocardioides limicola]|uniref:TetR/AcrR family transcriptional regulator n=1 Tax=Nocardioides limicola TaxID=2803368 RepID=UPI00193B0BA6|nr:TetR/AcrR family transcriptional regulator [Nocardioides sp. DJM-14]